MNFASDNCAGVHPEISQAIVQAADGYAASYGASALDLEAERQLKEIFECDLSVFFVATGTAANSLALAASAKPGGIALCHSQAHVIEDECGAPEFYSGCRLQPVGGAIGKIDPVLLKEKLEGYDPEFVHHGRPTAVTLTQSTELGTVYSIDETREICALAGSFGLPTHMDGARFANALVSLGASAAEMTWKAGVDYLSFGATKNGCWCAEALILFGSEKDREVAFLRKRAGQLFSKSRFIAAQFSAYLSNDLWMRSAQHANRMAHALSEAIAASRYSRLAWACQANEVFALIDTNKAAQLQAAGGVFYEWPLPEGWSGQLQENEALYRLVTSFATTEDEIHRFSDCLTT